LVYGYEPSTVPADLHCSTATNVASVSKWLQVLQKSQNNATKGIIKASEARAIYANRRRRPCTIAVGDFVMLSTKHLLQDAYQGARKLMPKHSGPYHVTASTSDITFRLDLPQAVLDRKVHNAFHASLLKQYRSDPYDRLPPAPRPIDFPDGAVEYEVDSIRRSRKRRGRLQYLVKWRGHDVSESTWQSSADLKHAQDVLAAILRSEASRGGGVRPLAFHATWKPTFNISSISNITLHVARFLRDSLYASKNRYNGLHPFSGSYGHADRPGPA